MADSPLTKREALDTLGVLAGLHAPVWLAGGLAADFHVGRWTRDHEDIDLVSFEDDRARLTEGLAGLGFTQTDDRGWITRWTRTGRAVGEVSLAFMRRAAPDTGDLVILEDYAGQGVAPGVYPGVSGNLDPARFGTVEGLRFRLVSAEDDWVFTKSFGIFRPGAQPGETDAHNLALLESVLDDARLEALRPLIGRRLPLEVIHESQ